MKTHHYTLEVSWTGNRGSGTSGYKAYSRDHDIIMAGKEIIKGSSDVAFSGDAARYNPEEMFLSSLSACHMLWYLNLCSDNGVIVVDYHDKPVGIMEESTAGGKFTGVTLYPIVTVLSAASVDAALELHEQANRMCFIANSCNFKVMHEPVIQVAPE